MTLRFYDTAAAEVRNFVPLVAGKASLYYCGATVQGMPHVGHIRSAIAFDQLTRWLEYKGLRVTVVRNVTDIDDKILAKSAESFEQDFDPSPDAVREEEWWALAYRYEQEFLKAGVRVRTLCPYFNEYMRPLGSNLMKTLGLGSLFVTYRNCANNTPLVLWAGDPWYPLFERKTN